jgi:hypothetical protein
MSSTGDDADARVALYELLRVAGRIQDSLRDVGTGMFELGTVIDRFGVGRTMVPSATLDCDYAGLGRSISIRS